MSYLLQSRPLHARLLNGLPGIRDLEVLCPILEVRKLCRPDFLEMADLTECSGDFSHDSLRLMTRVMMERAAEGGIEQDLAVEVVRRLHLDAVLGHLGVVILIDILSGPAVLATLDKGLCPLGVAHVVVGNVVSLHGASYGRLVAKDLELDLSDTLVR